MLSLREAEKAEHSVHPIDTLNPFCRGSVETNAVPETTCSGVPRNCLKGKYQASAENYEASLQHLPSISHLVFYFLSSPGSRKYY